MSQGAAKVSFVSTCQGLAGYWADDSAVALTIYGRFRTDLPSFRDDLSKRMADIVDDARRVGPMVRDAVSS